MLLKLVLLLLKKIIILLIKKKTYLHHMQHHSDPFQCVLTFARSNGYNMNLESYSIQ